MISSVPSSPQIRMFSCYLYFVHSRYPTEPMKIYTNSKLSFLSCGISKFKSRVTSFFRSRYCTNGILIERRDVLTTLTFNLRVRLRHQRVNAVYLRLPWYWEWLSILWRYLNISSVYPFGTFESHETCEFKWFVGNHLLYRKRGPKLANKDEGTFGTFVQRTPSMESSTILKEVLGKDCGTLRNLGIDHSLRSYEVLRSRFNLGPSFPNGWFPFLFVTKRFNIIVDGRPYIHSFVKFHAFVMFTLYYIYLRYEIYTQVFFLLCTKDFRYFLSMFVETFHTS